MESFFAIGHADIAIAQKLMLKRYSKIYLKFIIHATSRQLGLCHQVCLRRNCCFLVKSPNREIASIANKKFGQGNTTKE